MDKSKLEVYATIKIQISELEKEAKELKPDILAMMESAEADKIKMEVGTFTLEKKRAWTFTDQLESKRVELEELEAQEKATGDATYEENIILKFTAKKDKADILG